MKLDAVQATLFSDQLQAVCEEMGQVLQLSAYSPNIRERRDFSCALFDSRAMLIAQGNNIPVHLGSMGTAVSQLIHQQRWTGKSFQPGDVVLANNPYAGGTHLPDITAVRPFFAPGRSEPLGYLAARAHHADVGGMSSGSLPLSTEIYQEGLIIPPVRLYRDGLLQDDVLALICANSRTPDERRGDLMAQVAALLRGELRLYELAEAGADAPGAATQPVDDRVFAALLRRTAQATKELVNSLPRGSVAAEDSLETADGEVFIRLELSNDGQMLHFDFRSSDDQVAAPLNAVASITRSAVFYLLRCLLPPEVPTTGGLMEHVLVTTRPGSIVDALAPAAVAGGNVETSQRIVDVLLQAWGKLDPAHAVACSQGTMNNLTIGGMDRRWGRQQPFAYYETSGGGHGASAAGPGLSGRHSHMTNSLNTPVESLEHAYPLRVWRQALRQSSGGTGHFSGGEGTEREIELLTESDATLLTQRRQAGAPGAGGGGAGAAGVNTVLSGGIRNKLQAMASLKLAAGDRLTMQTPGGGGYGES